MYNKLQRLLALHRSHVFDEDEFTANIHHKALMKLKDTHTFKQMCEDIRDAEMQRGSDRLLRLWA